MQREQPLMWIVHCPAGGGHRAAAEAIAEQAAAANARAWVIDALAFTPPWFAKSYVKTHLTSTHHVPRLYGFGYTQLNRPLPPLDRLRRRVDGLIGRRLVAAARRARPDVVIGTHFFPLAVLGEARTRGELATPLMGVVTDYTAHAFWFAPGVDSYCVGGGPKGGAARALNRLGVRGGAIHTTGIPVRAAFGRIEPPRTETLHVLITSGGFGIGPLDVALRSFVGLPHVQLTVVCGRDPARREHVEAVARAAGIPAQVIGLERNMPARVAAADVILGKPGGLTVSEALAAGRPMALMGTCPGQEAANAAWLEGQGAAITVRPEWAGPHIAALHDSGHLTRMGNNARALGQPHAAADVIRVALEMLAPRRAA